MHMQDLHADISDTHFTQVHSYLHLNMQMGYNTPTNNRNRLLNITMSLHLKGSVQYPPEENQKYPNCRLTAVAFLKGGIPLHRKVLSDLHTTERIQT